MLRKLGIVLAVVALGLTSIQTDAFARGGGGGHGGGGGGHFGGGGGHFGGGGFGGGHIGGGFAGRPGGGFAGGHFGNHGGFANHGVGHRLAGRRFARPLYGGGDWGWYCNDWPYYGYNSYGYSCY